jgi:hypothetical protein
VQITYLTHDACVAAQVDRLRVAQLRREKRSGWAGRRRASGGAGTRVPDGARFEGRRR